MTRKLKEIYEKWGLDMNLNKTKYLCIGGTHNNWKLDKDNETEFCQEYKYLGVIFDTSGRDDKEVRLRVIQARKCIACLNGILWSKERSYSCLLQLSNIMPLRTVTSAPSVQYSLSETFSYVSKCPAGISYL